MTIQQAEQISARYRELVSDTGRRGSRQDPSLLPASKETILQAIQLEIAQLHFLDVLSDRLLRPLVNAVMFLDSFSRNPMDSADFIQAMQSRRQEIERFVQEVKAIARTDPFFWQRIYQRIGISIETRATSFFEGMRLKLGFAPKSASTKPSAPAQKVSFGRYILE